MKKNTMKNNKHHKLDKIEYKKNDTISKALVSLIILLVVIAIDTFSTYVIVKDAYANTFVTWGLSLSTAFSINTLPFILAILLKKRDCKVEEVSASRIIMPIISYVLIMGFLVWISLDVLAHQNAVQRDFLVSSISTQMLLTVSTRLIFVVITIATSVMLFIIKYISYQPLQKRMEEQENRHLEEEVQ